MVTGPRSTSQTHRIVYQSDEVVVTACGLVLYANRDEARALEHSGDLTLRRGEQTCPACGDFDWPLDVIRPFLLSHGRRIPHVE